jgi:dTDP-4-dehydrorhamnose 3,5-epimerase
MTVIPTDFPGLLVLEPRVFGDERGFFYESYNQREFHQHGIDYDFVQDNHSRSARGVLRGLHYQAGEHAQTKLVRVTAGAVVDVVVDIRRGSPTYKQHFAIELTAENKKQLLIPKGFAHGFVVISDHAEFLYKCDRFYHPEAEGGIYYADPELNIDWGLPEQEYIVSEKDKLNPMLRDADFDFPFEKYP